MKKFLTFFLFFPLALFAQESEERLHFSYKGFVDSYHAMRTQDEFDLMSSRSRVRFEAGLEKSSVNAFVSINAVYNPILEEQSGFFLREAYLEYQNSGWKLKAGKQIVSWGVADGLRITDLISPMDYTEFLAQDYDDIRVPVGAIKVGYGTSSFNIEGIWVPVPEYFVLPTDKDNPWAVSMNGHLCTLHNTKPAKTIHNSEYGLRTSFYFSGIDFSLCALHTWNKMPAFIVNGMCSDNTLDITSAYGQMNMVGGNVSIPVGKFVVRSEFAQYFGELQTVAAIGTAPLSKNVSNALLGIDWYAGNDWTIMLQYQHTYINNYEDSISAYRNAGMATFNIKKDMLHNTLKLSTFGRIDVANECGFFIRFNADYLLTDQITLTVGYDWFDAEKGTFAMYKDNSELFVKAKFSF